MADGEKGFCGIRQNVNGKVDPIINGNKALAHMYLDPLPTNCCAAWFCSVDQKQGYNLAVFFYGCNFNCLFCQNASHKQIERAPIISEEEMVEAALGPRVKCVCFFGGSPEPQLPFALKAARRIVEESRHTKPICWEWNGCGHPAMVIEAAELAAMSGGTVKFDLKAFDSNIAMALCGVNQLQAFDNFSNVARKFPKNNFLTATTLLVPYYVDKREVEAIARLVAKHNNRIPYSLLIFHPDYALKDLPITPEKQVRECLERAKRYLKRVHLGNRHLLQFSE
jgi:pyruvate formate lyase activating enzyme